MSRKRIAALAAALLTAGMLGGCGESTETNVDLKQMKVDKYVTVGDYSNLSVSLAPAEVDQDEWDQLTLAVYQNNLTADNGGITDRAVETGDTVVIDYEGKKDGVAFDGGTAQNASLTIGSGQFIDGFEDGLVGVMPGETVDLNLTFPEGYGNADLAGQDVVFTVTVHFIMPGADAMEDSVVAAMGIEDVGNMEELRQYVYDYLMEEAETNRTYNLQDALMGEMLERSEFKELPQTFLDSYKEMMTDQIDIMASNYGVSADDFTNYYYNMSSADYVSQYSEMQAKQDVLMQSIANQEELTVSDEELQEKLEEYVADGGYASVEELLDGRSQEEYRNYFMSEKVMDYLMSNAEVIDQAPEENQE